MFEKRKSRFTNTRSERTIERGLAMPEPAATRGSESCRGSGGTIGERAGGDDLGRTGGTGKPARRTGRGLKLNFGFLRPECQLAAANAVSARDLVDPERGALSLPPPRPPPAH